MPSETEHLVVASRNQELINHLIPHIDRFAEWITVIAFYKALHIVEAVFYRTHREKHGRNHESREQMLKTTKRYQQIYRHYRPLWAASTVARYLEDRSRGQEYSSFSDYLKPADVQARILNHYLRQLENSAQAILGTITPPSPPPPASTGA
jgi:hypothetical protein